jgi:PAS domain S-box-containing protein
MKIAAKVRLSHFSLALLVLAVGALGFFSVGQVSTQYERALTQTLPVVQALQGIRLRAEHVVAIAYRRQPGAVRGGEADEAAEAEADDLTPAFAALSDVRDRHRRLVETYFPDEQSIVDALDRESRHLREAAIELTRSPVQTAAGDAARRALKQAIDAIFAATGDALAEEQQELAEYEEKIDALSGVLQWSVALSTVAAFAVALLVGTIVARHLARPVVHLRDAAKRFTQRDLSVRATPHASDEVGELASAFNEMAQALGDTMVSRDYVENVLGRISDGVLVLDELGEIRRANPAAAALFGCAEADLPGRRARELFAAALAEGAAMPWPTPGNPVDIVLHRPPDRRVHLQVSLAHLVENDRPLGAVLTLHDVSALKRAEGEMQQRMGELEEMNTRLEAAQHQLLQSEKMAAIGQLAAGVAHEINNPVSFIHANLGSLARDAGDLIAVIEAYEALETQLPADNPQLGTVRALKSACDVGYLLGDLPKLIAECREGTERVRVIVNDLKSFSHADEGEWQPASLEKCLDSTLNIVWHELKYKAEVVKDYGAIPDVCCLPAQLSQVFMNLLVNAGQAIAERGTITLRTGAADGEAWVTVEDTGRGISPENLKRVFDPFFTTKPVGQGTGLGLSLAYGIIERHRGRIDVSSEPDKGTVFRITLPLEGVACAGAAVRAA